MGTLYKELEPADIAGVENSEAKDPEQLSTEKHKTDLRNLFPEWFYCKINIKSMSFKKKDFSDIVAGSFFRRLLPGRRCGKPYSNKPDCKLKAIMRK